MQQRTVRLSEATCRQLSEAAKRGGFHSISALIRRAVEREMAGESGGSEQHVTATLDQIRRELNSLHEVVNTQFAFVDILARVVLREIPERSASSAETAKRRYEQLLQQAAAALVDGTPAALRRRTQ